MSENCILIYIHVSIKSQSFALFLTMFSVQIHFTKCKWINYNIFTRRNTLGLCRAIHGLICTAELCPSILHVTLQNVNIAPFKDSWSNKSDADKTLLCALLFLTKIVWNIGKDYTSLSFLKSHVRHRNLKTFWLNVLSEDHI